MIVIDSDSDLETNQGHSWDLKTSSLVAVTSHKFDTCYDGRDGNRKECEPICSSDEGMMIEELSLLTESRSETKASGFEVGDLVWGKVESHPWWPGQICNEALAPSFVRQRKIKGCLFVSFFGDGTYNWLHPKNLLPFECHFHSKSIEGKSKAFQEAIKDAIDEVNWREEHAFACRCLKPSIGYGKRAIYVVDQAEKSRREFKPADMVSFLHKVALRSMNFPRNGHSLRSVARILAYRKAIFVREDPTYDEAFEDDDGDSERASDDCGEALAQGAASTDVSKGGVFSAPKNKRKVASSSHARPSEACGGSGSRCAKVVKAVDGPMVSRKDYDKTSEDHVSKDKLELRQRNECEAEIVDKEVMISECSEPSTIFMPLEKALAIPPSVPASPSPAYVNVYSRRTKKYLRSCQTATTTTSRTADIVRDTLKLLNEIDSLFENFI